MALRDLIKTRLAELKMTQGGLAAGIGVHPSYVSDLMHGRKSRIQPRFVEPLAQALQVTPDELFRSMSSSAIPARAVVDDAPAAGAGVDHGSAAPTATENDSTHLAGPLTAPWIQTTEFAIPTGSGRLVPIFSSRADVENWRTDKAVGKLRWPTNFAWSRSAYAWLEEVDLGFRLKKHELILACPEIEIRPGDLFLAFSRNGPPLYYRLLKNSFKGPEIILSPHKTTVLNTEELRRTHRVLSVQDADPG